MNCASASSVVEFITFLSFCVITHAVKCECKLRDEPIRTMCIGPSVPPCNCDQPNCEVSYSFSYS